ncbi:MAG: YbaB/EbfC family nucleoid-associated protein [Gammaproteobacteria bacterium]
MADQKPNIDFNELMEKAKEMQSKMQQVQAEIAAMEIEGVSGGGLVKVVKRGNQYATKCRIDPTLVRGVSSQDREMLEDLIVAAINDAVDKIESGTKERISKLAGMDMPDAFKNLQNPGDATGGIGSNS